VVAAAFKEFVHPVTLSRVKNIKQIKKLPECDCSICQEFSCKDMIRADSESEIILALHNLNIFLKEMEGIREASRENNLRDYIKKRAQTANRKVKTAFEAADKKVHGGVQTTL
jgi:tRNA-guanine family transglycosylase